MRVKHLNKGVSGLSTTPGGEMFTRQKTRTHYSSGLLRGSPLNQPGEWGPFCSREEDSTVVLSGLDLDIFSKRPVLGQVRKLGPKG